MQMSNNNLFSVPFVNLQRFSAGTGVVGGPKVDQLTLAHLEKWLLNRSISYLMLL